LQVWHRGGRLTGVLSVRFTCELVGGSINQLRLTYLKDLWGHYAGGVRLSLLPRLVPRLGIFQKQRVQYTLELLGIDDRNITGRLLVRIILRRQVAVLALGDALVHVFHLFDERVQSLACITRRMFALCTFCFAAELVLLSNR
jgi:hypothetical protein